MIRVLLEGRDAPLYHCTNLQSAVSILASGELRPTEAPDPTTGEMGKFVCFTRDKRYVVHEYFSIIQLVFDQAKLYTRYKIRPTAEEGFLMKDSEMEERIPTTKPIPVKPYLVEIEVVPGNENLFAVWVKKATRKPDSKDGKAIKLLVDWWANGTYKFGPSMSAILREYEDKLL